MLFSNAKKYKHFSASFSDNLEKAKNSKKDDKARGKTFAFTKKQTLLHFVCSFSVILVAGSKPFMSTKNDPKWIFLMMELCHFCCKKAIINLQKHFNELR
jgi:hypothetical protein